MESGRLPSIYDFELFPYALGDVLTWNIQTAIRAVEAGDKQAELFVCVDPTKSTFRFQTDLVTPDNSFHLFAELFGAFTTGPNLGNVHIFTDRSELVNNLKRQFAANDVARSIIQDYEFAVTAKPLSDARLQYFNEQVHSHEQINSFYARQRFLPLLNSSWGCEPEVDYLLDAALEGRPAVVIHPRLRRLDQGMRGETSRGRDSEFLEWYEFLRIAEQRYPDVQFIVVGRLQEKPLEILRLPNVMSLRPLGLGLGHELTLILKADLFIGTSSGFAAMANFSTTPYFITKMTQQSCKAYDVPYGSTSLPFAAPNQVLVYENETTELLLGLLESGLQNARRREPPRRAAAPKAASRAPGVTTFRYFLGDAHADHESHYLLGPHLEAADRQVRDGDYASALDTVNRVEENFPRLSGRLPELRALRRGEAYNGKRSYGAFDDPRPTVSQRGRRIVATILAKVHLLDTARTASATLREWRTKRSRPH
jgi:hypothetical protein